MVDGGSAAEVMYHDLYRGLNLKLEDLTPYNSPLISFDKKLVIPKGMIRLSIQTSPEIVEVKFIVVAPTLHIQPSSAGPVSILWGLSPPLCTRR